MHPNEVAKEFINKPITKLDGLYYGGVIDINDPDHLGRVKVAVYNILDKYQISDMPWAYPQSSFIGSKTGSLIVPPIDSIVNVIFQNGDIHLPIYLSTKMHFRNSLPSGKSGRSDPKNIIFYETDEGDYFEINRTSGESTFNHSSGASITITKDGKFLLNGAGIQDLSLSTVTPSGMGPFCALPTDPYTGMLHSGSIATGTIPLIKG